MCQPIQQNIIMGIKSNGLRYGLEHREKEAQLLSIALHGVADYGLERGQTLEKEHYYIGRVATSSCLFKKALFFVMDTHTPHLPPTFHL